MDELYETLAGGVGEDYEIRDDILFEVFVRKQKEKEEVKRLSNKEW